MPTPQQTARIAQLETLLTPIAMAQVDALVQQQRLGDALSFEAAREMLVEVISSADRLRQAPFARIPASVLATLLGEMQQVQQVVEQMKAFNPQNNGAQTRDTIINNLETRWGSAYPIVRLVLSTLEDNTANEHLRQLTSQVQSTLQLSSDALGSLSRKQDEVEKSLKVFLTEKGEAFSKEGKEKLSEMEAALAEVRKAAEEAGVSQTATHFRQEAREHQVASRWWLFVLLIAIALLIGFSLGENRVMAWAGIVEPSSDASAITQARYLIHKGLIVFCLLFALFVAAKNYAAARHNYVVNKHRNNALGSFQAFAASASDDQTKSAVLIQATQSIFTPQPSGYVKTDGDNAPASPVIEILRSINPQSK
jgi:hypothetical protein